MAALRLLWGVLICAGLAAQTGRRSDELERALQNRDFARAEALLGELVRDYPREAAFRERLGLILLRRGALEAAESQILEAVRLSPAGPAPYLALARMQWLRGDREGARAALARAAELGADDPAVQQAVAELNRQTGDGAAAAEALSRAIELAPGDLRPRLALAELYLDHRTPEGALATASAALQRFPANPDLLRIKALAHYGLGESHAAIDAFLAAIDADPSSEIAHASLETLLPEAGERLPAIRGRLETFSLDWPESPIGPYLLGLALAVDDSREPRVALMLREAVRREPDLWPAWFELHRALESAGDVQGAIEALETAERLNPEHPATRFALARLYAAEGRKAEAVAARREHHRLMSLRREAERRRQAERPRLPLND